MVLIRSEREAALDQLPDWRFMMHAFRTAFVAPSYAGAAALIAEIGAIGDSTGHHPDVDWRDDHVFVRTATNGEGGVTAADVDLALAVSAAAARNGATARPELVRFVEIAIDTADPQALAPTWAAALGYEIDDEGDVWDPFRRGPALWFQRTESPDPSRFHIDVSVADDRGDPVLDEVVAAGGTRIDERFRPSFTVVADGDGNRLCICVQEGRD